MTYEEAIEILLKAKKLTARQSEQINGLANAYMDSRRHLHRDREKALTLFRMAAEKGCMIAEYNLGYCYEHGEGVEQDYSIAVDWYLKSANHGYDYAMNNLAIQYEWGQGVDKDYKKAAYWLKRAVRKGNSLSKRNLAFLYVDGLGVRKSIPMAKKLMKMFA